MSRPAIVYRVLVASPSNMEEEQKAVSEVIHDWNTTNSYYRGVYLETFLYEAEAAPQAGDVPQTTIDKHLIRDYDMLIGVFWTQLAVEKEIEEFKEACKPVLLCFSSAPVVPGNIDARQYRELLDLKGRYEAEGTAFTYGSIDDFRGKLQKYMTLTLNSIRFGYG